MMEHCHRLSSWDPSTDEFVRCGAPEDHPLHDPSSSLRDTHPFSPWPPVERDLSTTRYLIDDEESDTQT